VNAVGGQPPGDAERGVHVRAVREEREIGPGQTSTLTLARGQHPRAAALAAGGCADLGAKPWQRGVLARADTAARCA